MMHFGLTGMLRSLP